MTAQEPAIHIEFIPDGSSDAPLILIYGSDKGATRKLFHAFRALRDGREDEIAIHKLPRFEGVGGVELFAKVTEAGTGITQDAEGKVFRWQLSDEGWQKVEDLLAPFCDRYNYGGFQWLVNAMSGQISVIFSTGRGW